MVTNQDVEDFITDDSEWKEIIRDLINNDYTVEALKQDYKELRENNELDIRTMSLKNHT